jgi:hypothetical protein
MEDGICMYLTPIGGASFVLAMLISVLLIILAIVAIVADRTKVSVIKIEIVHVFVIIFLATPSKSANSTVASVESGTSVENCLIVKKYVALFIDSHCFTFL